jgi:protein SCO1/2
VPAELAGLPLVDQQGREFRLDSLQGRVVLLVFGFTNCPHICPVEMARVTAALQQLDDVKTELAALFVTVDPARDSPEVIRNWLQHFHPAFLGVTGEEADLTAVAEHFRVKRELQADPDGGYLVDHGFSLYILDREGRAQVAVLPGLPPSHVASLVRDLL